MRFLLAALTIAMLGFGVEVDVAGQPAPAAHFVGSESCKTCHAQRTKGGARPAWLTSFSIRRYIPKPFSVTSHIRTRSVP